METFKYAPYSYSKMSLYKSCPRKFKFNYIDKIKIKSDKVVFERGNFLHKIFELYPNKDFEFKFRFPEVEQEKDSILDFVYSSIETNERLNKIMKTKLKAEQVFNFNLDLKPIKDKKNSIFTGFIDHLSFDDGILTIVDWKSGKTKNHSSIEQLRKYAIWAFSAFKQVNQIDLILWYVEQNELIEETLNRDSFNPSYILTEIQVIETDSEFQINKTEECKWCDYFEHCNPFNSKIKMKL